MLCSLLKTITVLTSFYHVHMYGKETVAATMARGNHQVTIVNNKDFLPCFTHVPVSPPIKPLYQTYLNNYHQYVIYDEQADLHKTSKSYVADKPAMYITKQGQQILVKSRLQPFNPFETTTKVSLREKKTPSNLSIPKGTPQVDVRHVRHAVKTSPTATKVVTTSTKAQIVKKQEVAPTTKAVAVKSHGHVVAVKANHPTTKKAFSSTKKTKGSHHTKSKAVVVKSHGHVVTVKVNHPSSKVSSSVKKTKGSHHTKSKAVVLKSRGHVVAVKVNHPTSKASSSVKKTKGSHHTKSKAVVVKSQGHVVAVKVNHPTSKASSSVKKTKGSHHTKSKAVVVKSHGHVVAVKVNHPTSKASSSVKKTKGSHHTNSKAVVVKSQGHVVAVKVNHPTSKVHVNTPPVPTSVFSPPPPMRRGGRQQTLPQTAQPAVVAQRLIVTEINPNAKKMDKLESVLTKMMLNSMNGNKQKLDEQNRLINVNRVELPIVKTQQPPARPVLNTQTNGQTSKITAQTSQTSIAKPVLNTQTNGQTSLARPVLNTQTNGQTSQTSLAKLVVPKVIPAPYKMNRYENHHHEHRLEHHHEHHREHHHSHHHRHHHDHDDDEHDDHDDHDDDDDDDDHDEKWRESRLRFLRWKRDFFNRLRLSKLNREHIRQRYIRHFH